jgi:hypothetical protein
MKKISSKNSKKSRFSFVNNDTENIDETNIFNVPDFVEEILKKKFILLSFTNLMKEHQNDAFVKYYSEEGLLAEEMKIIQKWALAK